VVKTESVKIREIHVKVLVPLFLGCSSCFGLSNLVSLAQRRTIMNFTPANELEQLLVQAAHYPAARPRF
jgi:hypothetical protein